MSKKQIETFEKNELYASYQADLTFEKELNILRNDFYYQMIDAEATVFVDFMYRPLDILSGDAYSARRIDENKTFYLLVDGMGKGVSASFTAVIMTTFINHLIDKMIEHNSFSMNMLISESIDFIKPVLLEDEVLAIDYICFDSYFSVLEYAKFAMPPFLLHTKNDGVIKLKSNNTPLSKWQANYKIDRYNIKDIDKFLFYSDGIVENSTIEAGFTYAAFIEEDFKSSFTREDFKEKFFARITQPEDDLTLIFINRLDMQKETLLGQKVFSTSLEAVERANVWYEEIWQHIHSETKLMYRAGIVFSELFMNAYEHGNLGLDSATKHKYIEEDIYFEKLKELQKECSKNITVSVYRIKEMSEEYIITKICDEGEGFDTQILSQIFRNSKKYNGRGVFVSRKNSMGIYYNSRGNCVLFLNKI